MPASKFALYGRLGNKFFPIQAKRGKFIQPEGAPAYYARFTDENHKRKYRPLGTDFAEVVLTIGTMEIAKEYERRGMEMPVTPLVEQAALAARIDAYLDEIKANKARKTWLAYGSSLRYFKLSCKRANVQTVTHKDMMAFKMFLRGEKLSERAVYNNFLNVMIFLKWAGVQTGVPRGDWPSKDQRAVDVYDDAELDAMFEASDSEERILLKSFLYSGLRSGEMAHLTYGDVDFKSSLWTVQAKAGWTTKTEESKRQVPVPPDHTEKIRQRMLRLKRQPSDFVFPAERGGADLHMLRIVKRVAKRAKIAGRIDDHKFRSTCATRWLSEGWTVEDVRTWLGHSNLNTVQRYLKAVNLRSVETQKKITNTFARFATVGGD
jgi:integrase